MTFLLCPGRDTDTKIPTSFGFIHASLLHSNLIIPWVGLMCLSRRNQQLERTEGESELNHLARIAAVNLEGVQGIGDWGHESDGESIELDLLSESH